MLKTISQCQQTQEHWENYIIDGYCPKCGHAQAPFDSLPSKPLTEAEVDGIYGLENEKVESASEAYMTAHD
jgi:hypothetical protein